MHNHHKTILLISTIACVMAGCTLEEVRQRGSKCPPAGETSKLSYIQMGSDSKCREEDHCDDFTFLNQECPLEYDGCYADSQHAFYCLKRCQTGTIACNGTCIDPKSNPDYCGAKDTCADKGYGCCTAYSKCGWWQTCSNSECVDTVCLNGTKRCTNGIAYVCKDKIWVQSEVCQNSECNKEETACQISTQCRVNGETLENGQSTCDNYSTKSKILYCNAGVVETVKECKGATDSQRKEICELSSNGHVCTQPVMQDCTFNGKTVPHNTSICDNNIVRTCFDGQLDASSCPPPGEPELAVCLEGKCTYPLACTFNGKALKHQEKICNGNILNRCNNGEMEPILDCRSDPDGYTVCLDNACIPPRPCTGPDLAHGSTICSANTIKECYLGEYRLSETCPQNATCTQVETQRAECLTQYRTINALHRDYTKLINQETCSDSSNRDFYDTAYPADISVEGVVTAVRPKYGFIMQEPSTTGKKAGIYVYCQGNDCMKYTNTGENIQVGDNLKVTSDGIGHYYCQMQIRAKTDKLKIEKLNTTNTISPVVVGAKDINTGKPNGDYYASLVTVERFTSGDAKQSNPTGWPGVDEDNHPLIVNNGIDSNVINNIIAQNTYQITGIVNWAYNNGVLVPRNAADIIHLPDCATGETAQKCLKTAGVDYLTTCNNGLKTEEISCTQSGQTCDDLRKVCRSFVTCSGNNNTSIQEDEIGCTTSNTKDYLATCVFNEGNQGTWDIANATLCPHGCNTEKLACELPPIDICQYANLDVQTHQSTVRVDVPNDLDVTTNIYCTTDLTLPIQNWPYSTDTKVNHNCTNCSQTENAQTVEFITNNSNMPATEGKHYCVAIASVKDGKDFLCKPTGGKPINITPQTVVNAADTQSYTVSKPILAGWNFEDQNLEKDEGSAKAKLALVNAPDKKVNFNTGYNSAFAASSQAGWSSDNAPIFASDPHWEIQIDTTGYKNISIKFQVTGSGSNPKNIALAYKTGSGYLAVGTDISFADKNVWHEYPITALNKAENNINLLIGIFPFGTTSNPNIRIDNIEIYGDKI